MIRPASPPHGDTADVRPYPGADMRLLARPRGRGQCSDCVRPTTGHQPWPATPPAAMPPAAAPPAATPDRRRLHRRQQRHRPPPDSAAAPAAPPTRIRGTIAAVAPHLLTVNSRDGSKLEVTLTDPLTVRTLKRVPLSSVKDGAFSVSPAGRGPTARGSRWKCWCSPRRCAAPARATTPGTCQPGSMMTNAPVTGVASAKAGRDLTLTYQGGSVTIHVPPRRPW